MSSDTIANFQALAESVVAQWGCSNASLKLLKYRENAVFEVRDDDFHAALRIHRQDYHPDNHLEGELAWMAMLAESGLVVPQPILTTAGELMIHTSSPDLPGIWQVDMLSWLDGEILGEIGVPIDLQGRDTSEVFASVGATMAKLHTESVNWPDQGKIHRHAWDSDGLVGDAPFWGEFWALDVLDPEEKALVLETREALRQDLAEYGRTADNFGLIHADFVPENVMLNGDSVEIIDFDDAGFGWHMFDIVTALFWLRDEPEFEVMKTAYLSGYQSKRSLVERDLATWDLFMAARSLTYLGWAHTRPNSDEAKELAPLMIANAVELCTVYLNSRD